MVIYHRAVFAVIKLSRVNVVVQDHSRATVDIELRVICRESQRSCLDASRFVQERPVSADAQLPVEIPRPELETAWEVRRSRRLGYQSSRSEQALKVSSLP